MQGRLRSGGRHQSLRRREGGMWGVDSYPRRIGEICLENGVAQTSVRRGRSRMAIVRDPAASDDHLQPRQVAHLVVRAAEHPQRRRCVGLRRTVHEHVATHIANVRRARTPVMRRRSDDDDRTDTFVCSPVTSRLWVTAAETSRLGEPTGADRRGCHCLSSVQVPQDERPVTRRTRSSMSRHRTGGRRSTQLRCRR